MSKKALSSAPANRTALPPPSGADVPRPDGSAATASRTPAAPAARTPAGELAAWLAKYGPVERAILEARERRDGAAGPVGTDGKTFLDMRA